jgi:hypothetical protein
MLEEGKLLMEKFEKQELKSENHYNALNEEIESHFETLNEEIKRSETRIIEKEQSIMVDMHTYEVKREARFQIMYQGLCIQEEKHDNQQATISQRI